MMIKKNEWIKKKGKASRTSRSKWLNHLIQNFNDYSRCYRYRYRTLFSKEISFWIKFISRFFFCDILLKKKYLVHRVHSFICCSKYVHHLRLYSNRHLFVVTLLSKERKKEKQKLFHYKFKGRAKQWPLWKFAYIFGPLL